uniref:Uncharacterized protein n=1 Tax=Rangifer tarandus platyrhynchus TaxID=3082113 RepID=A0ACB0DZQ6_RANTA|nr:unnamed protein product [Rangifer tarandus platyrhynchus]
MCTRLQKGCGSSGLGGGLPCAVLGWGKPHPRCEPGRGRLPQTNLVTSLLSPLRCGPILALTGALPTLPALGTVSPPRPSGSCLGHSGAAEWGTHPRSVHLGRPRGAVLEDVARRLACRPLTPPGLSQAPPRAASRGPNCLWTEDLPPERPLHGVCLWTEDLPPERPLHGVCLWTEDLPPERPLHGVCLWTEDLPPERPLHGAGL